MSSLIVDRARGTSYILKMQDPLLRPELGYSYILVTSAAADLFPTLFATLVARKSQMANQRRLVHRGGFGAVFEVLHCTRWTSSFASPLPGPDTAKNADDSTLHRML